MCGESDESTKNPAPNHEPAEMDTDHILNDVFHHVRGQFVESLLYDNIDLLEYGFGGQAGGEVLSERILKIVRLGNGADGVFHFLAEGTAQGFQGGVAAKHIQHAAKGRFLDRFFQAFKGRVEIDIIQYGFPGDLLAGFAGGFPEESLQVFAVEKLLFHQLKDAGFEFLEPQRNDPGSIEPGHLLKKHVNSQPIRDSPGKSKQTNA